jgi:hypothetical protein
MIVRKDFEQCKEKGQLGDWVHLVDELLKERDAYRKIAVDQAQINCDQECFNTSDGCAYQMSSAIDDAAQKIMAGQSK